ncbi:class I SAM-dependent methyltransferase [Nitrosomonas aestuarii]|uniref:class I SAM-dependent methyltransferase n=1 Tax=Nitrosomonas aestuarii TaxID=52441 RepID=UPI000D30A395|nr:class I SAM-dependent methyltransferase [Nitrosomonas aestuarii]PTN12108.1 methyltransferase family protein [Nitrosomonas aestuarii]
MNESLTIFTSITASYTYSSELRLSLEMLQQTFPHASWIMHTPDSTLSLKELVSLNLPPAGYILFIKEPAMLASKEMYPLLKKHLEQNPETQIALPNDPANARIILTPNYHTLRGFEQFSQQLTQHDNAPIGYDGRECWLFLISAQSLSNLDLPDDLFELPHQLPAEQIMIIPQAYTHPFYNYYRETRPDILPFVPEKIQSLLDIGCSRGGFAATVKKTIGCRVAGIEINRHEAEVAQATLDALWVGDVLSLDIHDRFDCISCLDVLEHMPEPEKLLSKIKQWLTPDGNILLNVPNVGFWAVVDDLLAGRWDYVPAGILCNTHLRFYTEHSLRQLLDSCGLTVTLIEKHCIPIPEQILTGFNSYQKSGLDVDYENLATNAFTVLAKCK